MKQRWPPKKNSKPLSAIKSDKKMSRKGIKKSKTVLVLTDFYLEWKRQWEMKPEKHKRLKKNNMVWWKKFKHLLHQRWLKKLWVKHLTLNRNQFPHHQWLTWKRDLQINFQHIDHLKQLPNKKLMQVLKKELVLVLVQVLMRELRWNNMQN